MYAQAHTRLITFSERVNPVCGNLITDIRPIRNSHPGTHTPAVNTIVRLFRLIASGSLRVLPPPLQAATATCFKRIFVICCYRLRNNFIFQQNVNNRCPSSPPSPNTEHRDPDDPRQVL